MKSLFQTMISWCSLISKLLKTQVNEKLFPKAAVPCQSKPQVVSPECETQGEGGSRTDQVGQLQKHLPVQSHSWNPNISTPILSAELPAQQQQGSETWYPTAELSMQPLPAAATTWLLQDTFCFEHLKRVPCDTAACFLLETAALSLQKVYPQNALPIYIPLFKLSTGCC